jgi:hypothetical protein
MPERIQNSISGFVFRGFAFGLSIIWTSLPPEPEEQPDHDDPNWKGGKG